MFLPGDCSPLQAAAGEDNRDSDPNYTQHRH